MKKEGKFLRVLLGLLLVFTCFYGFRPSTVRAVAPDGTTTTINDVFPDTNLAIKVAAALSKSITDIIGQSDLDAITKLTANVSGIADLDGMQYVVNLEELYLLDNDIVDISPLAGLTKLVKLDLTLNHIVDLTPLSGLINLERLLVGNNEITDVSPLATLVNLTYLEIGNDAYYFEIVYGSSNKIADISSLSTLVNLEKFSFEYNGIGDISVIASLPNLNYVWGGYPGGPIFTPPTPPIFAQSVEIEGKLNSDDELIIINPIVDEAGDRVLISNTYIFNGGSYIEPTNKLFWPASAGLSVGDDVTFYFVKQISGFVDGVGGPVYFSGLVTVHITGYQSDTITVTYDANGGTGSYTDPDIDKGSVYNALSATDTGISNAGFVLLEWNTLSDGTGDSYLVGDAVPTDDDITLYAIWGIAGQKAIINLVYDANGGSGGSTVANIEEDDVVTILTATAAGVSYPGHTFVSWNTEPNGSGTTYQPGDLFTAGTVNVTLYAQWATNGNGPATGDVSVLLAMILLVSSLTAGVWVSQKKKLS